MTTLVEFIEARMAEDVSLAVNAAQGPGFGSDRIFAEVELKNRLLDTARIMSQGEPSGTAYEFGQGLLRNLARPYVDHPDYQTEWRSS